MANITNTHTHIFTSDHVPPYLGKSYLPFGLAYIFTVSLVVKIFQAWYHKRWSPYRWQFQPWYKRLKKFYYRFKMAIARNILIRIVATVIGLVICAHVFFILYDWLSLLSPVTLSSETSMLEKARKWLADNSILFPVKSVGVKLLLILVVLLFIQSGRNLIFFLLKRFFKFIAVLPGKQTFKFLSRYLAIGRFAFYKTQDDIFEQLEAQYPAGTRFVVLPMDMEYMGAGKPNTTFAKQMEDLVALKKRRPDTLLPFIFIDPRRIRNHANFFKYTLDKNNNVVLDEDCDVKKYLDAGCCGFKIYPALGYYAFEEELLPVWKYAVQNDLPIITHCIRGTIFYRGKKESSWDTHTYFKEDDTTQLLLPEIRNQDFANNFTHPLNYICVLKEHFLRQAVESARDPRIKSMFGFVDPATTLTSDLSALKLCFGHFGGDDEWTKYFESDRDQYTPAILHHPYGIDFLKNSHGDFSNAKLAQLWRSTDWYSIICSLMLQHPNVYADISYIIQNQDIWPLLKDTLDRDPISPCTRRLSEAVLFGTDFYVVRNHKSEKQLLAELEFNLPLLNVDQIARENPLRFVP